MEITLYRSFPESDFLAGRWNALLAQSITPSPFLRYEYLRAWWQGRGGGEWPQAELALILATLGDYLLGVAPLFWTESAENQAALFLLGSVEISDYLDIIVRPEDTSGFLNALLEFLPNLPPPLKGWKALDWHNLLETSPTLHALRVEAERRGWTFEIEKRYHAPSIPLPGDFEAYLASLDKKHRHEIRRKMRRAALEAQSMRWYFLQDPATLEQETEAFLNLMTQDPQKATFLTPAMREQMRLILHAAFEGGWLQLAFLEIDGVKAAAYLNFDYANRIWVYNSGLDRRFLDLSPGWVLLGHLLQWANENGRQEFDFMRGNEEYKYRFGGRDRFVMRVKVSRAEK